MIRSGAGSRRVTGWVALVAGLGALAAGLTTLTGATVPPDAGVLPMATIGAAPAAAPRAGGATGKAGGATGEAGGATGKRVAATFSPTGVAIADLRIDAPVDPVGVTADGALSIPGDPARLGWWIGSADPGSPRGTVLLAGHVDTAADGPGALFKLERLPMGALIDVRAGEKVVTYRAVARRSFSKRRLPADLFSPDTPARLVLITCGGEFHDGSSSDNVVLYAVPKP
jgi:hypothetical protein